jgi:hypothetical protein
LPTQWKRPFISFIEVPDINAVISVLKKDEIVQGLHETFYGAKEVVVKEPGGHFVIFSQLAALSREGTEW